MWMAQAHWQYGVESTAAGILRGSSVLKDEALSQTNTMLVHNITEGAFKFVNIVEVSTQRKRQRGRERGGGRVYVCVRVCVRLCVCVRARTCVCPC